MTVVEYVALIEMEKINILYSTIVMHAVCGIEQEYIVLVV